MDYKEVLENQIKKLEKLSSEIDDLDTKNVCQVALCIRDLIQTAARF